jgi:transcriptional regulator with XRE-family HTH domain
MVGNLRSEKGWSQERLAELSGLSLRTIQRIEGCNAISAESMTALARAFDLSLDALEKELGTTKGSTVWKQKPAWVRALFLGSSRIQMDKRQHVKAELTAFAGGVILLCAGLFNLPEPRLLICGSLLMGGAYLMSVTIRIGDAHGVWRWLGGGRASTAEPLRKQ